MSAREERKFVKYEFVLVMLLVLGGFTVMAIGSMSYLRQPFVNPSYPFYAELDLGNDQKGDLRIESTGGNGLIQYRLVNASITVNFHEGTNNTSNVDMEFPNARVLNPNDDPYIAKEGKHVVFNYTKSDSKTSTYSSKPYLIYYTPGDFNAILSIKNDKINYKKEFGTVINIESWDSYFSQQSQNRSEGTAWMIVGIALISAAPTFTKLADLGYKAKQLKKKEFYE